LPVPSQQTTMFFGISTATSGQGMYRVTPSISAW
jgi:hypothetical protein